MMVDVFPAKTAMFALNFEPPRGDADIGDSMPGLRKPADASVRVPLPWLVVLLVIAFCLSLVSPVWADSVQDEYKAAVGLYGQKRWKQAAEQFRAFLIAPKHDKAAMARLYLGLTLLNLDDYKEARVELRKFADANKQNPNYSQARYRVGECSYLLDDFQVARGELEGFVKDFPDDSMCDHALPYLGDIYLQLNDPANALRYFDQALAKFPRGKLIDDARFGRARSLESLKQFDDAIAQYQQLAAQTEGPRAADAQFFLGKLYFERKQYDNAIAAFTVFIKTFPKSVHFSAAQLNCGSRISNWVALKTLLASLNRPRTTSHKNRGALLASPQRRKRVSETTERRSTY